MFNTIYEVLLNLFQYLNIEFNKLNIIHLKDRLVERLKGDLPGEISHRKMNAKAVSGQRLKFKSDRTARRGAVLILLFEQYNELSFVLTQRPDYNGTHGGQVSFPGGKQEDEDSSLIETALREAEEEIGINRRQVEIVGTLSEYFVGASNHLVLPVVGVSTIQPKFVPDTYEVAEILPVPLAHLLDQSRLKSTILEVGQAKYKLDAPYFDLNDKVVWGATAGMLSEFKDILIELDL